LIPFDGHEPRGPAISTPAQNFFVRAGPSRYSSTVNEEHDMGLREDVSAALKDAMKAGDKKRLSTLRLMQAAIKDKDINSRTEGHDSALTADSGIVELFAKMVKQRQDSIAAYEQGGRPELAQNERDEIAVIQSFMPKQMTEEEATAAVAQVIKDVGATSVKDMGKVMAELKARFAGQMDLGKAGGIVKSLLG
jgi:hypothetical protein